MVLALPRCLRPLLLVSAFTVFGAWAELTNVTIDDVYGDTVTGLVPTYSPPDRWSRGDTCTGCLAKPDDAWRGTWHDTTQHPDDPEIRTISIKFNGTAVYVYNALAAYIYGKNHTIAYYTFDLDGQHVGDFYRNEISGLTYNVPVFTKNDLSDGLHELIIRVPPGPDGKQWSWALFDYVVYTTDLAKYAATPTSTSSEPPPSNTKDSDTVTGSSSKSSPTGAIVGGVVGGLAALLAIGFAAWFFMRRRHRGAINDWNNYNATPAVYDNPGTTGYFDSQSPQFSAAHSPQFSATQSPQFSPNHGPQYSGNPEPQSQSQYSPSIAPVGAASMRQVQVPPPPESQYSSSSGGAAPSMLVTRQADPLPSKHAGPGGWPQDTTPYMSQGGASQSFSPNRGDDEVVLSPPGQYGQAPQLSAIDLHDHRIRELEQRLAAVEPPPQYDPHSDRQ